MRYASARSLIISAWLGCLAVAWAGCAAFVPAPQSDVAVHDRPIVAILPFGFDVEITRLAYVKSVDGDLSAEEESNQLAQALQEIRDQTRWMFLSRLAAGQGFRVAPLEDTDTVVSELQMTPGTLPTREQVIELRQRLGADLVVAGTILDYGKIRWQWLAAGMFADMTAETIALGLATAWNPIGILANVGFELLTSTPVWFGGGYLFGVAFRPVRLEARALETVEGYPVWQAMEESVYAWNELKQLPEDRRDKKESQLLINLGKTTEALADSLTEAHFTAARFQAQPSVAQH